MATRGHHLCGANSQTLNRDTLVRDEQHGSSRTRPGLFATIGSSLGALATTAVGKTLGVGAQTIGGFVLNTPVAPIGALAGVGYLAWRHYQWRRTIIPKETEFEANLSLEALDAADAPEEALFERMVAASTEGTWDDLNSPDNNLGITRAQRNMARRKLRQACAVQLSMEAKMKFPYLHENKFESVRLEVARFIRDRLEERKVRPTHAVHLAALATQLAFIPTEDEVAIGQMGKTRAFAQRITHSELPWHSRWDRESGSGLRFTPK